MSRYGQAIRISGPSWGDFTCNCSIRDLEGRYFCLLLVLMICPTSNKIALDLRQYGAHNTVITLILFVRWYIFSCSPVYVQGWQPKYLINHMDPTINLCLNSFSRTKAGIFRKCKPIRCLVRPCLLAVVLTIWKNKWRQCLSKKIVIICTMAAVKSFCYVLICFT